MDETAAATRDKALAINRDPMAYGTIAEIGAGQEVARWFFHVGGAAGTVAKAISAYDMAVSDGLYGPTARYVSRTRLESMLAHEYAELVARLGPSRGDHTAFFAFADTVATHSFRHPGDGRGWLGIRFQPRPLEPPSEVVLHATLRDLGAAAQQEALGILGVSLIHAATTRHAASAALIGSLLDDLSRARAEIDMIQFSGPAFASVDNRLASLQLVEQNLTDAAVFLASGETAQASDLLYKKPVLVERGSFRPVTHLTLDVLERARARFLEEPAVAGRAPVVLMEMTLRSLTSDAGLDHADFLARADILAGLGLDVLISRFDRYYQLADYLAASTDGPIGLAVGLPGLREIAQESYYQDLPGGILESTGRLFKRSVKMYVYPTRDPASGRIESVETAPVPPPWQHVRDLLLQMERIEPIRRYDERYLSMTPRDVLALIRAGDPGWERLVPPTVAETIKAERLFGYTGA
jgi:hypothetical protein